MSDFSSLLKYEEIKQQTEFIQISQKAYGCNYNISQTLKWAAVFGSSEDDSFTCLAMKPHRELMKINHGFTPKNNNI